MPTVNAVVCIPWRDTGCPHRRAAFDYVYKWWRGRGYGIVVSGGLDHEPPYGPFNLSAVRNHAAEIAVDDLDADVLIFADADTIPEIGAVDRAIVEAWICPGVIYPHDHYWVLTQQATSSVLAGFTPKVPPNYPRWSPADFAGEPNRVSVAGVIVCTVASWEAVGRFDERFEGWGGEDVAFSLMARDVLGRAYRFPGNVWHLWHPRDAYTTSTTREDLDLLAAYRYAAAQGPHALRALRSLPDAR